MPGTKESPRRAPSLRVSNASTGRAACLAQPSLYDARQFSASVLCGTADERDDRGQRVAHGVLRMTARSERPLAREREQVGAIVPRRSLLHRGDDAGENPDQAI